jgi:hypothetical protein
MDDFFKLLDDLMRPGNWPFLVVFALVNIAGLFFLGLMVYASVKEEKLNLSYKFFSLWVHVCGGKDDPKIVKSRFRKVLYVKITRLANRSQQPAPFYTRTVDRLSADQRHVPVYDEAIYCTLKLYPQIQPSTHDKDTSHGIVDARLVIPWTPTLLSNIPEENDDLHTVLLDSTVPSDTMYSVSHFLNALQGPTQSFSTYADQDAESLRLLVDFSSVPNAAERIQWNGARLTDGPLKVDTDDLKSEQCTPTLYMANCKNAKEGYLLSMDFTFKDWETPRA